MDPVIQEIIDCGNAAALIATKLQSVNINCSTPDKIKLCGMPISAYCFSISASTGKDLRFDTISISVPPGSQRNRTTQEIIDKPVMETALIKNNELVYIDNLGYDDIKRFYDFDNLLNEINNLVSM